MKNEEVFNREKYESAYPDGIQFNYWNSARNQYIYNQISKLSIKNNILDIGCGRGIVVDYLRERNLNCFGVELGKCTPITQNVKDFIFTGTDVFTLPNEFIHSIEVILLLDVLEHTEKPETFLETCINHFKNLKYIFITLPARKELWTNYDDFYGHYKRYDLESCKQLMNHFSFKDVTIGYFFHLLYFPIFITHLLKQKRVIQYIPPQKAIEKFFHKVLGKVFYMDSLIIPKSIPGSSISILIEK